MDSQLLITFAILIVAIGLLLSDRLRPDLVALLVVVALGLSGVLTPREAFSGFSRQAVITIMAIFILTGGLERSGVTARIGDLLLRAAGSRESRLVGVVMLAGAGLSLFMNNIAAAAVLLPAAMGAARKAGANPARLLMPLAFGTILGGMATLLTTTNIVVSSLLRDQGLAGYRLVDFAPVGLPLVAVGVLYTVLWGRHRLPAEMPMAWHRPEPPLEDLVEVYRLGERLLRMRVSAGSPLAGQTLAQCNLRARCGGSVLSIERRGARIVPPSPDTVLQAGDVLLLEAREEDFPGEETAGLEILPALPVQGQELVSARSVLVEAVLAPRSALIGQTLHEAHFREKYGLAVVAIWRAGRPIRTRLSEQKLQFGDALLLQGPHERLALLRSEPDLIVLSDGRRSALLPGRAWLALTIVGLTLVLAAVFSELVGEIMLVGALAMVAAGVLTMDQAYQSIEWKSVFLVAGMLPLGAAMTKTGAAALLADQIAALLGPAGPLALLAGLVLLAALLTQAMNGAAVAAVVAPLAIQAALHCGADPRAYAMGVALATSLAFATPLGHPVNVLVMASGGYRFRDYLRVGLPLVLILFGAIVLLLPLFWPL